MDMAAIAVPQWYREARNKGASRESLLREVEAFCLKALQRNAARHGEPAPETVEPEVLSITVDMYESALLHTDGGEL